MSTADINECELNDPVCDNDVSSCQNTVPFYNCDCLEGFFFNETSKKCEGRPLFFKLKLLFVFTIVY